ncbi:MAG: L-2-amino-thiazoline-4-carboxylic acid hydrolase [Faecalibacterium sp.]|nr:L-2-amino-thiazoline-4-carboxylic acid hydrolase [Ruminococcus sp.]MCM1392289.1 L-2-amino-thiazoline-4-carboxylic acid hydrolase [Ruminococcus sp.]MCM1486548.1 L-2-amino-thiazoline-4-carboxylic acid hydrolase [Faecalibacterium sp.]
MKYTGMTWGMWILFKKSFCDNMVDTLGFDKQTAVKITIAAKQKYKDIIMNLPEFEKADQFKINLVNSAMFAAFYLNMPKKPSLDKMTEYYEKSMMTAPMKWFCQMSGKQKFSPKDINDMKKTAALRAAERNPYSWNMDFYEYKDGSGYEARFTKCGICTLMNELGISDVTPALCNLDYAMSKASGVSDFVRKYTLASGGPYCDCGYKNIHMRKN